MFGEKNPIFNNFSIIGQNIMKQIPCTPKHQGVSTCTKSIARGTLIWKISTWQTNYLHKYFCDRFFFMLDFINFICRKKVQFFWPKTKGWNHLESNSGIVLTPFSNIFSFIYVQQVVWSNYWMIEIWAFSLEKKWKLWLVLVTRF
jgi:hypothetical protein